ncbi:MAG: hypothetical protein HW394_872, partial [Acidobacteria bacterium]|nr:hypothetical protein [Acidobacteriota bacterium]
LSGFQDPRPLPDPDTFSRTVREHLARAERVAHLYAFKERRTDVHTNPFGRIGTGGTRLFEVYPSATRGLTYRRLVERSGIAVDARELAGEDREYRARAADVQRRLAAEHVDEERRREADSARARQRGQRRVDAAIDALQFRVEGRTVYEGVPAIVVSFTPRPGARPDTREGRIAQTFAGTVWIHEAAAEVMRVEAKSIDDISFGFGLVARLGKGTQATLTRRPVEPDLWMPTELTMKGRGRAAVFRTLVVDFAVDWFDYRRLEGNSATPFLDSRVQRQPGGGPQ